MKIYLDICCLKRPFDDQTKPWIRAESRAIASILEAVEQGKYQIVRSPALDFENSRNPIEDRRAAVEAWLEDISVVIPYSRSVESRAKVLNIRGIKPLDSFHLAFAEEAGVDYFLTCDKKLLKFRDDLDKELKLIILNPIEFIGRR